MLGMSVRRFALLVATAALLGAGATAAQAADAKSKQLDFTVRTEASPITAPMQKWDAAKGRWGVILNLQQPDTRPGNLNDIQAGAYYRITPSLRVGGAVALGQEQLTPGPKKIGSEQGQPRVRLESSFKF